jgi:hypothetical protein
MTGYAADEEETLRLLVHDQKFLHVTNLREQIAIAGSFLRRFVDGRRMTIECIGRFFGVRPAIIQAPIELAKSRVGAPGRRRLLPLRRKSGLKI